MKNASAQFEAFEKDIKAFSKTLKSRGYMERPVGKVIFSWVYNIILAIVPFVLFFYTDNWIARLLLIYMAGLGSVGVATMAHNASHGVSFKNETLNRILDIFGFDFILGVSSRFWDNFHNIMHHHQTSIIGQDPDTSVMPWFALHEKQIEAAGPIGKMYYKIQWIFFPFLFGFYSVFLQYMGWIYLYKKFRNFKQLDAAAKKLIYADVIVIVMHYLFWIALFSYFFPISDVLIIYVAKNFITGAFCFFALAPTHWTRDALYFEKKDLQLNYYARQAFSTVDYKARFFGSLVANGVEYHLEHHFFPNVSHVFLNDLSKELKDICVKNGMPYKVKSWPAIIWDAYLVVIKPKVVDNTLAEKLVSKPA